MQQQTDSRALLPIAILIDELQKDDVQVRLNSIHKLDVIARALGPQRTREELVPYLGELMDDEDEVLLALAQELSNLIELTGGGDHGACLLGPLETLATVEDTAVRDKAVASMCEVSKSISEESTMEHLYPLVLRLAEGDWFTGRVSSCGLFPVCYPKVKSEEQANLRGLFIKLASDDTPMVRRSATSSFGRFVQSVSASGFDSKQIAEELLPVFFKLTEDDQDSVRLLVVENCIDIGSVLSTEQLEKLILPVMSRLCTDKSWRVRYMVAEKFLDICRLLGEKLTRDLLVDSYVQLLSDSEAEVRSAAASRISGVAFAVKSPEIVVDRIIPVMKELVCDPSQYTRAALAAVMMDLTESLSKESVFEHILPSFLQLLKDEYPDVRLNIISKLDCASKVVGVETLSQSLFPAIVDLAVDKKWRVRLAIIERTPLLAEQLGVQFFEDKLCELCLAWLGDEVHQVREAAARNLSEITKVFGVEWSRKHVLPRISGIVSNSNYLYRQTSLFAAQQLHPILGPEASAESLLPMILKQAEDPVPNVRFLVCKTLKVLCSSIEDDAVKRQVSPVLEKLAMSDDDIDVRFYAKDALACI